MIFSAHIGVGILTFATAEPSCHFQINSNVILCEVANCINLVISLVDQISLWDCKCLLISGS